MQRVSDSWRSTMGSTAIAIVLAFCDGNPALKDSDENRQEFAAEYLEQLRFLYEKSDDNDAKVSTTSTRSQFSYYSTHFTEI